MYIENEYQRLSALVRDNLSGATLVDWQPVEISDTENAYIVMWVRHGERREYGTHRAVVNATDGMLVWGNYLFNVMDATTDYNLRVNGTEHVS